jgi:hypothetical protein
MYTNNISNNKVNNNAYIDNNTIPIVMGAHRKFIRGGGIMKSNTKKNTLKKVYSL